MNSRTVDFSTSNNIRNKFIFSINVRYHVIWKTYILRIYHKQNYCCLVIRTLSVSHICVKFIRFRYKISKIKFWRRSWYSCGESCCCRSSKTMNEFIHCHAVYLRIPLWNWNKKETNEFRILWRTKIFIAFNAVKGLVVVIEIYNP